MSCDRYRKMLHLNRSGELTEREAVELDKHLKTCRRCAQEREKIAQTDPFLSRLRGFTPTVERPDELADRIIASVRQSSEATAHPGRSSPLDRVLDYLSFPPIRYASVAFIVVAVGALLIQYFSLLQSVESLEETMADRSQMRPVPEVTYSVRVEDVRHLADPELLKSLGPFQYPEQSSEVVIINSRRLRSIVSVIDSRISPALFGLNLNDWKRKRLELLTDQLKKSARTMFNIPFAEE